MWVFVDTWFGNLILNGKYWVVDSDFSEFCKLLQGLCFFKMDNFLFLPNVKPVRSIQLHNFETTNWGMGRKPPNFCIIDFLVESLRTLFLTDYLINILKACQLLFLFIRNVGIVHKLRLNLSEIL